MHFANFVSARKHIQVARQRFTGSPAFDDSGNIFVPNPSQTRFVGDPAIYPEIDHNWDNITWGRYIVITKKEAIETWGTSIDQYWDQDRGGYVAG
ncbi:hypothetical protein ACQRIT_000820 [Beauveria bassiana]